MGKRRVTINECDKCGAEVDEDHIYKVVYSNGTRTFMRCDKHNRTFIRLYEDEEAGWEDSKPTRKARGRIEKVSV